MKDKKDNNNLIRNIKVTSILIVLSVLLLSFAYASESITTSIENVMAKVRPIGNAIITRISVLGTDNGGSSSSEGYNVSKIYSSVNLPNQDSSVTYRVDVSVMLSPEMKITNITGLNSNLEYEITNYTLGDVLCNSNNECNYGATKQLEIIIRYKDGCYDSNNTLYAVDMDFTFAIVEYVAKIGNTRYNTLRAAVLAVPKNDTETTVLLLKNTSEKIDIDEHQNIKFNLQNYTISNSGSNPVITNEGTLTIYNGTITSNATQGAINNETTGHIIMSGGQIIATGSKQAIYNGGYVEISDNAYLSATSNQRAPLQNLSTGTILITGGTIVSTRFHAIDNAGTLTIGEKDGVVSKVTPFIQGDTYGIVSTTGYHFYDGAIEGKTESVDDEDLITDIETSTEFVHGIDGAYKKLILGEVVVITFDPNGGQCDVLSTQIDRGDSIGSLPTPIWARHVFDGWFTQGGTQIFDNTPINNDITLIAHWTEAIYAAEIGNDVYETLQAAVNAVPTNNNKVVIRVLKNIDDENIVVNANKNIEFDLQNFTISNTSGTLIDNYGTVEIKNGIIIREGTNDQNRTIQNRGSGSLTISGGEIKSNVFQVIRNYGTLNITGGKIWASSAVDQGVINNERNATMHMSGGQIIATLRQAIYNDGGTLTISGNPSLTNGSGVTANRACVQNHSGTTTISGGTITSPSSSYPAVLNEATMTITGGNINSLNFNGVNNTSSLTIGVKDQNINSSNPVIVGNKIGINNTSTLKIFDGIVKGINKSINGNISDSEGSKIETTEIIDGISYFVTYYQ